MALAQRMGRRQGLGRIAVTAQIADDGYHGADLGGALGEGLGLRAATVTLVGPGCHIVHLGRDQALGAVHDTRVDNRPNNGMTPSACGQPGLMYRSRAATIQAAMGAPPGTPPARVTLPSMTAQWLATAPCISSRPRSSIAGSRSTEWRRRPAAAPRSARPSTSSRTIGLGSLARPRALHYYLDASALAFADRNAYVADPAFVQVPTRRLLSQRFANCRARLIPAENALPAPAAAGDPSAPGCPRVPPAASRQTGSTTHLSTSDRWGNVVSYTLTIEQTGGSGIVVPERGFLLNNELTDFNFDPATGPNTIEGGKRPRSSMAPTIVLRNGRPFLAVGSPGGSTIITTVLQTLVNRIDFQMSLPEAIAAPRASHRNNAVANTSTPNVTAEQAFIDSYGAELRARGYDFTLSGAPDTSAADIGAVAALEFRRGGLVLAAAEPDRRGGGSAGVVYRVR